jgi:hypothetical protein
MRLLAEVLEDGCAFVRTDAKRRDARRLYRAGLVFVAISKYRPWTPRPVAELELFATEQDMHSMIPPGWRLPVLRAHRAIEEARKG